MTPHSSSLAKKPGKPERLECIVLERLEDSVFCEFHDCWGVEESILGELSLDIFTDEHRAGLVEGSVFYLSIDGGKVNVKPFKPRVLTAAERADIATKAQLLWGMLRGAA